MSEHLHTNALAQETSPYLLQHAHNPVQWYPWCAEALNRAADEDKPILLSIGYSACHWCHVMERESFENEDIASLMNKNFINIKVDREERPDLDAIYMNSVQLMTGSGGWPLTVFLTPDLVPFYGGTYFPPADRHGMPGFPQVLQSVAKAYRDNRAAVQANAAEISANLKRTIGSAGTTSELTCITLDGAIRNLVLNYDSENGGFGSAPKFPPSMALGFLLRSSKRKEDGRLLEIVEQTLGKMAHGGIYDQLGGGFHRYSVDPHWLVPHFEKMLYDNALLSRIYLDAYLVTKNQLYRRIAEETLDYVLREMTSPEGGFYSTQDADSEGHEGEFFLWTPGEVEAVLGEQDADLFNRYYDVTPEGNFEQKNILHVPRDAKTVAKICGVSEQRLGEAVSRGRRLLHAVRNKRIKPGRDEKILTAWNGLMLRSFAEAANTLNRDDYRDTAVRNAEFMLSRLQSQGMLLRSFKDGKARFNAYLEDYAFLADGLLALYEATFDIRWLREAMRLGSTIIEQFKDPESYGFYFTSANHERLIQRPKEFFDNAVPSGNSVAAFCLLKLWKFTSEAKWLDHARPLLEGMAAVMERYPSGFGNFLSAADFYLSNQLEIAVVGDPLRTETQELLRVISHRYLPNKVVACGTGDEPFLLGGRRQINHKPTAYVCSNYACRTPVTTRDALEEQLAKS